MRRHCVPIGLLRRDPRRYRFPLPNAVWEYKLKPIEFVILSYHYYCHSHSRNDEEICAEAVAKAVHLTVDTVKKYLSALFDRRLITDEHSLAPAFQFADNRDFFHSAKRNFSAEPSALRVHGLRLSAAD